MFFNKGENCIAAGRLFVEESIHDKYVERVVSVFYDFRLYKIQLCEICLYISTNAFRKRVFQSHTLILVWISCGKKPYQNH